MIALLSVLFHVVFIWPLETELDSLARQEQDLKVALSQRRSNRRALSQSIQSLDRAQTRLDQLQTAFPGREDPFIMSQIQQLARSSHLKIKRFVPLDSVPGPFYQEHPNRISLEGGFHNLGRFLEEVGECEQIINITNVAITGVPGDPSPGTSLQARMTASTFILVDPASDLEEGTD